MTAPGSPTAPAGPQPPGYPPARRDDLAEDLHGQRVPDPYRWLEDAASADTQEWLAAQDTLWAARGGRPARAVPAGGPAPGTDGRRVRRRPGLARAAAVLHAPPARAGARGAADRRPRRAGAGAHRPGGPGSGRADHARLLAAGHRRAGCSPTSCPPAGTRSRNSGCWTSCPASRWTAPSAAAATPRWPGCPAARRSITSASSRRTRSRRVRSSSTAGCTCTRSARPPRRTC